MCCLPPPFMLSPGRFTGSSPVRHLWLSAMVAVVVLSRVGKEIKQTPEVELKSTDFENGTRLLVVTWKAVPPAERAGGVNYTLTNPQHGCPGSGRTMVSSTNHRLYVTYSAVNLSISVTNGAGTSTPRYFYEPAKPAKDLKACEKNLTDIHRQVPKNSCVEWYEFKEEDTQPTAVKTLLAKMCISKMLEEMEDYVRYSYLEHKCDQGVPQTVEMCLLYKKEGVPLIKPLDFTGVNETDSSVDLSWLSIPPKDQRAFITHYALCHSKTNQSQEIKRTEEVCRNLSASQTKFRLENLAPETEYNISLAGVTRVGSGPRAILILPTFPPKQPLAAGSFLVWISLGLLITFFVASILCSFVVKRFKSMIFPPIPKPILCSPFNGAANQQELEQREQVDEVSVHLQLVLGGKHHSFDEEDNVDIAKTLLGTDEDQIQRESFESPGGQEEALYRNGLVFDMKAEEDRRSPESWCG
ncbi:hypothetical protein NHX12_033322 [Muraenolepis orangiensis]|uniref:Fibronectin type-III domain-containing protein n=1 Tax=Muraenolepis orangiensis TaxID=630683 RepID=A0A9Q0E1G1_9TELE|nr:hypothetical protein NHX12_033322 [Muraenolepis orangiensis]